jgi:hypothetical protein
MNTKKPRLSGTSDPAAKAIVAALAPLRAGGSFPPLPKHALGKPPGPGAKQVGPPYVHPTGVDLFDVGPPTRRIQQHGGPPPPDSRVTR